MITLAVGSRMEIQESKIKCRESDRWLALKVRTRNVHSLELGTGSRDRELVAETRNV